MSHTVAIEDLQVGMFIHLDLGWMSHPFPLSSFRISTPDEITRIHALGLRRLRWSPEKSVLLRPAGDSVPPGLVASSGHAVARAASPAAASSARAARIAAEREAARLCDAQYGEASNALRDAVAVARQQPVAARQACEQLAQSLVTKMLGDQDLCILVLSGNAGEKATAHPLNVAVISLLMARQFGLPDDEMLDLGVGAMLHDIGKLDLPHRVQFHDDRLSSAEIGAYRDHVRLGVQLAQLMGVSAGALEVIAHHHELADGSGFPARIGSERLSTAARIVALVNRFDNLCNPRSLGRSLTPHEALSRLFTQHRGQFDAAILNSFIRMMGVYPAGSVVQLTDDRYAIVTHVNSTRPLKPRVMVYDPAVARDAAQPMNLAEERDLGIRRSLPPAQLPEAARNCLHPVPRMAYYFESLPAREPVAS